MSWSRGVASPSLRDSGSVALKAAPGSTIAALAADAADESATGEGETASLAAAAGREDWDDAGAGAGVWALAGGVGVGVDVGEGAVGAGEGTGAGMGAGAGAGGGVGDDRKIHGVMENRTAFHTASPASRCIFSSRITAAEKRAASAMTAGSDRMRCAMSAAECTAADLASSVTIAAAMRSPPRACTSALANVSCGDDGNAWATTMRGERKERDRPSVRKHACGTAETDAVIVRILGIRYQSENEEGAVNAEIRLHCVTTHPHLRERNNTPTCKLEASVSEPLLEPTPPHT